MNIRQGYGWKPRAFKLCLFIFLLVWAWQADAQGTGSISGTVYDPAGLPVPDVDVTATNTGTEWEFKTKTNQSGFYQLLSLLPGTYKLVYEKLPFSKNVKVRVTLHVSEQLHLDKKMELGGVSEIVEVLETAPLVETTGMDIRDTLGSRAVTQLPIGRRDFTDLLLLSTGSANSTNLRLGETASMSVEGSRPGSNNFVLDGIDNNRAGFAGIEIRQLPFDTIQEVSISFDNQAEVGLNSGALINVVSRSGTNEPHGSVYYFNRNRQIAASDFFESENSPLLWHQFGLTAGGPLARDRAFVLGGYEGTRELRARVRLTSVPSSSRLAAARSIIAANSLTENPLSTRLLQFFPSPDRPGPFNNRDINSPLDTDSDKFLIRIDHMSASRNIFFLRYNLLRLDQLFPLTPSFFPGFRTAFSGRDQSLAAGYTLASGAQVNEVRFGYQRNREIFFPEDRGFDPLSIGLNTGVTSPQRFGLPFIKISGFDALGAPVSVPLRRIGTTWQLTDNFSKTRGKHTLKAGIEFRRVFVSGQNDSGTRGRITFDGSILGDPLADFLAGLPAGNTGILRGDTQRGTATNSISWFFQDTIRLLHNLTLNLGLRYEFNGVIHEEGNRLSNFAQGQGGLIQVGSQRLPGLYENDLDNFGPRVGLNWDPTDKGKFVIRAGWGLFFDTPTHNLFVGLGPFGNSVNSGAATNPVGPDPVFSIAPSPPIPFGPGVPVFGDARSPIPPFDLFAVQENLATPYRQNLSLGIQYEFLRGMMAEVDYVGSIGVHLFRLIDLNQPAPGDPTTKDTRRPFFSTFPQFRSINMLTSDAKSNYHALRVLVKRRLSQGLAFDSSWTFSKSIDDASSAGELPQDSRNLRAERAVSSFDQRHRFAFSGSYELPFGRGKALGGSTSGWVGRLISGWQISAIATVASGTPVTPIVSLDVSGTGVFADRPNKVGNPRPKRNQTQFIDPNAFRIPPQGTFGNAGRNSVFGPGLNNWNFSTLKNTHVKEPVNIEIRFEFFNLFNHPNFGPPNTTVDEPAFGSVNGTDLRSGRREIQVGMRIVF